MKVLGAATWVRWCTMMTLVVLMPSILGVVADECGEELGYGRVVFDVTNSLGGKPGCYSKFLTRLRNLVEAPSRVCGLQSTRESPLGNNNYVTVDLKISNKEWVTLGIDVISLYVWGYQDKYNGTSRATFVKDAPQDVKDKLGARINRTTNFEGKYDSLEPYAKITRNRLTLRLQSLYDAIKSVYGKPKEELDGTEEAKFFLVAIQMVSEAARFKFMEKAIIKDDNTDFTNLKRVCFQNNWAKISIALFNAERDQPVATKCTDFKTPLLVSNAYFKETYYKVDEVKSEMGLLKYTPVPSPTSPKLVALFFESGVVM